ncbi:MULTISPECIES: hypothetical protein [unclassified Crossiella]|uniref:hypothetical protein n=1 Tax=unclassified Crossiella TaxID=2620835 RepID=UPI001FFEB8F4|nr:MULTISPECIES: hypothetical protein [unclassified Crossiella]MCK2241890.1 hypothetical protein [Crossiella sp. S99.2]MCK2255793.1 hypothetical protein [Crossiella sp. S99.1]
MTVDAADANNHSPDRSLCRSEVNEGRPHNLIPWRDGTGSCLYCGQTHLLPDRLWRGHIVWPTRSPGQEGTNS